MPEVRQLPLSPPPQPLPLSQAATADRQGRNVTDQCEGEKSESKHLAHESLLPVTCPNLQV
jgi:hypothetical protein